MHLTKEQRRIQRKNRQKAREYFGIVDDPNLVLHHKDPSWAYDDIDRYIQWNPDDLVVMTNAEHTALHNSLSPRFTGHTHTEETLIKLRARVVSEENKKLTSERLKGVPKKRESVEKQRTNLKKYYETHKPHNVKRIVNQTLNIVYESQADAAKELGCSVCKVKYSIEHNRLCNGNKLVYEI